MFISVHEFGNVVHHLFMSHDHELLRMNFIYKPSRFGFMMNDSLSLEGRLKL